MDALRTPLTQIPRSHFKSTELDALRNGVQESIIFRNLTRDVKKERAGGSVPWQTKLVEVVPQDPAFSELP